MAKQEFIIENCTQTEIAKLEKTNIEWYPDDLMTSDVCIYGTRKDVESVLKLIGRTKKK